MRLPGTIIALAQALKMPLLPRSYPVWKWNEIRDWLSCSDNRAASTSTLYYYGCSPGLRFWDTLNISNTLLLALTEIFNRQCWLYRCDVDTQSHHMPDSFFVAPLPCNPYAITIRRVYFCIEPLKYALYECYPCYIDASTTFMRFAQ